MQNVKQISAHVSTSTKERLTRYAEAHGLKKGAIIEAALLHHLQALEEIPQDLVVPARVTVSPESFESIQAAIEDPPPPTEALRALMSGQPVEGLDD